MFLKLYFNNNISLCNVTARAFICSWGEVVLFCLCLAFAFETWGHSTSMANSGLLQRFLLSACSKALPALGLNAVSSSDEYFALQSVQDRILMAGLSRDAYIFLCLPKVGLALILQQLSEDTKKG